MEVVEHEPHSWFLLRTGETYMLDINCTVSAAGFSLLIQLTNDESTEYEAIGRVFIQSLAARVQHSPAHYYSRDLTRTHGASVGNTISAWRLTQ